MILTYFAFLSKWKPFWFILTKLCLLFFFMPQLVPCLPFENMQVNYLLLMFNFMRLKWVHLTKKKKKKKLFTTIETSYSCFKWHLMKIAIAKLTVLIFQPILSVVLYALSTLRLLNFNLLVNWCLIMILFKANLPKLFI